MFRRITFAAFCVVGRGSFADPSVAPSSFGAGGDLLPEIMPEQTLAETSEKPQNSSSEGADLSVKDTSMDRASDETLATPAVELATKNATQTGESLGKELEEEEDDLDVEDSPPAENPAAASHYVTEDRETQLHVCNLFCRTDMPPLWTHVQEFCDSTANAPNCEPIEARDAMSLGMEPGKDHGFVCRNILREGRGTTDHHVHATLGRTFPFVMELERQNVPVVMGDE